MPTIEGKQAGIWINDYVQKAGKFEGVAQEVRALVKKAVKGVEEYVNPWKIPSLALVKKVVFEGIMFGTRNGIGT
jgi:hypothetical protein